VRLHFFVSGALFASWGVQVPAVKLHYALGDQALAIAMLAAGVGAVASLTQAGGLVGRYGPRLVAIASGALCAVSLAALFMTHEYAVLLLLMLAFGVGTSLFDVSINAAASDLERLSGRTLMSGFHGMFSLGGMAGAAIGSALLAQQVAPTVHLVSASVLSLAAIVAAGMVMLRTVAGDTQEGQRFELALGLIAEGAMYDWSVLYMTQDLHSEPGFAALAYASFSAAMASARFGGDWVRERVAPAVLMSLSAALAAVAMALVLVVANPVVALIGFALVGLGFANVVPVLFSAASKVDENPAHGIAAVASLGYLGMMAGPPLVGVIAEHASLTWGLASVAGFAAVLSLAAPKALKA